MKKISSILIFAIICIYFLLRMPAFASEIIRPGANGPVVSDSVVSTNAATTDIATTGTTTGKVPESVKDDIDEVLKLVLPLEFQFDGFGSTVIEDSKTNQATLVVSLVYYHLMKFDIPMVSEKDMQEAIMRISIASHNHKWDDYIDHIYVSVQSIDKTLYCRSFYIEDNKVFNQYPELGLNEFMNFVKVDGDKEQIYIREDGVRLLFNETDGIQIEEYPNGDYTQVGINGIPIRKVSKRSSDGKHYYLWYYDFIDGGRQYFITD